MTNAEFGPLRPRRIAVSSVAAAPDLIAPPADVGIVETSEVAEACEAQVIQYDSAPSRDVAHGTNEIAPNASEAAQGSSDAPVTYDEARIVAEVRAAAVRFASIATARALRVALADEGTIATYVDDALRACGRLERATVRLHPVDAASYRPNHGIDVVADDARERGEIVIEMSAGVLGATIEERADLLARAAAW